MRAPGHTLAGGGDVGVPPHAQGQPVRPSPRESGASLRGGWHGPPQGGKSRLGRGERELTQPDLEIWGLPFWMQAEGDRGCFVLFFFLHERSLLPRKLTGGEAAHACTCMHTHACTRTRMHTRAYACIHTHTHAHTLMQALCLDRRLPLPHRGGLEKVHSFKGWWLALPAPCPIRSDQSSTQMEIKGSRASLRFAEFQRDLAGNSLFPDFSIDSYFILFLGFHPAVLRT